MNNRFILRGMWLYTLLLMACPIFAAKEEPIVVKLASHQIRLLPIYIAPIFGAESELPEQYIGTLEKVLRFDIGNNGLVDLISPTKERTAKCHSFDNPPRAMENEDCHFITVRIQSRVLAANLFLGGSIKSIGNIPLSGDLSNDRKQIHLLADALHKALFGKEGIASTHILYTKKYQQNGKWLSDLWEADYDGANAHKISQPDAGYCITPVYVPPKAKCRSGAYLYVSYKSGQPKIYLSTFKDRIERSFIPLRGSQIMPAIASQRDQIAFISDASGNPDLFLQPFDAETGPRGKPRQIYANYGATQGSPTFSPDGKSIAFVSNKDGSIRIYVMEIPPPDRKLKDIKPRLISRVNKESSAPAWSPDGTKLAYSSRSGSERQIWIYEFNTGREWQLTTSAGSKENPAWAPNSLHLVFNTTGGKESELYMINVNQRKEIHITSTAGDKRFPAWEPL